jgi:hypothetical protein
VVIVDAAIESDGQAQFGIFHGLTTGFGQVDDFQPSVRQAGRTTKHKPGPVRSSRLHDLGHGIEDKWIGGFSIKSQVTSNTAHKILTSLHPVLYQY